MKSRTGNATGDEKKMISNVIPFPNKAKYDSVKTLQGITLIVQILPHGL